MTRLRNLSIRQKLIAILILPILLVLFFLGREIRNDLQLYFALGLVQEQAEVTLAAGDLVHELQSERGLTYGSRGISGRQSRPELIEQRLKTNSKLEAFNNHISTLEIHLCSEDTVWLYYYEGMMDRTCSVFNDQINAIRPHLTQLQSLREHSQTNSVFRNQVFQDYSLLIDQLMRLIFVMSSQSQSAKISNYIMTYYFFLVAKDLAGKERAILYDVFIDNRMLSGTRERLIKINAEQGAFEHSFKSFTGHIGPVFSSTSRQSRVLSEVQLIRQIALNHTSKFGISADRWFALASERMDLLQQQENEIATGLQLLTKEQREKSINNFKLLILFSVLSLACLAILTHRVIYFIHEQLNQLTKAMQQVEESSDFSIRSAVLSTDELGNVSKYFNGMLENLSIQKDKLKRSYSHLNLARSIIEASKDGIVLANEQGIINYVNPAFIEITGYTKDEALGKHTNLLKSGRQGPEFYQRLWGELQDQGYWQGELWNRRKNGEIYPEWLSITAIRDPESDQKLYVGIFSDITDHKRTEALIENLAYYDPLTCLPNRQLLSDRVQVALSAAQFKQQQVALISIDLDHFQRINTTLGHLVGDQVIQAVAQRFQNCIKEASTLSRFSGDCFVILYPDIDNPETINHLIERIFMAIDDPIVIDDQELFVTISLGASFYPTDAIDKDSLLKHADSAMHRAKEMGRNNFQFYSVEMNEKSLLQLDMGNRLRKALQNEELFIVYQPKVDIGSGEVVGVEALLRWKNDKLGMVSPEDFIPLAEDLGLIGEIGAWVLRGACKQCRQWQKIGYPGIHVSVNVSPRQIALNRLEDDVKSALASANLAANFLDLEITESCIMDDLERTTEILRRLRNEGVTISMDDFGTGYSSLSYLKQIPLDYLKIDQSFMNGIPGNQDDEELVSTIILMAQQLKYFVIAEGVETFEQLSFLKKLGCDQIQGYYFSRPLLADKIPALLATGTDKIKEICYSE